jgi:hypothetical protein
LRIDGFAPVPAAPPENTDPTSSTGISDESTGISDTTSSSSSAGNSDNGSGLGDPQFHGFAGQSFQVHGVDGSIYSIISDELLQLNARFDYLDHGVCPSHNQGNGDGANCWSHPGSYFGLLTFQTSNGDRLRIAAGSAVDGFESVVFNGKEIDISITINVDEHTNSNQNQNVDTEATNKNITTPTTTTTTTTTSTTTTITIQGKQGQDQMQLQIIDKYHIHIKAGIFTFNIENSDKFINILSVSVQQDKDRARLRNQLQSHGILGQTWRVLKGNRRGRQIPEIEGVVEDYANSDSSDEWAHDTTFNKFTAY